MPQQINLCTPILLTQRRYFSAQTMVQALAILAVVGGGLLTYWVWSLNSASQGFKKTLAQQSLELEGLQSALKQGKTGAGTAEAALTQELQGRRTELLQREKLLKELQEGLFRPGWGHSARLQLVAQSIPSLVWVTEVKANEAELEVSGFTLNPAALNDWAARLAASELLKEQKLATVKVENASAMMTSAGVDTAVLALPAASSAMARSPRSMWKFNLVSAIGQPSTVAGDKP